VIFQIVLRTYKTENIVPCRLAKDAKGQLGHYEFRSRGAAGRVIVHCRWRSLVGRIYYRRLDFISTLFSPK